MHACRFAGALLWCVCAVALAGCATRGAKQSGGQPMEITEARLPGLRHNVSPGRYVFRDSESWREFWAEVHTTPAPEFDFDTYTLVAVFQGMKPNPGYGVKIEAATEYPDQVIVEVVEYLPHPDLFYPQIIMYPFSAVLIPKTGKPVAFHVTEKVGF
ncbi:MAG: hypothetical protein Kow0099_12840 [Candidatus Abyssubacteria bacterium]